MTKLSKIFRIVAAVAFLTALAVNVKVTLTDPFVGMSNEAIATGTDSGSSGTGGIKPKCVELGDNYPGKQTYYHQFYCQKSGKTETYYTCENTGPGCQEVKKK